MNVISVVYGALGVLGTVGWVKCIVKLVFCDFEASYKAEVIYAIGVFSPLGSILGWMDFGK